MFSLADLHCDTLTAAMRTGQGLFDNSLQLSLKRLLTFEKSIQLFAIWLTDDEAQRAFENTVAALDFFDKSMEKYGDLIKNKVTPILSVEGCECIGENLDRLRLLYSRGVRLATLTWNRENALGYPASAGINKPLKPFGRLAIEQMERLGIIVDVSHLNEAGFYSVCEIAAKPFAATHSNAYSLCKNARNLTDEQLKAINETGSIVGINLYPPFLNESETASISDILLHIDYMGSIVGEDKLCLGCDFDGIDKTPTEICEVSALELLYDAVIACFGKAAADKIFYLNAYNFLKAFIA